MTDNEIIKALECCGKSHRECLSECPRYNNEMYARDCRRDLLIKANLLAKRQQAEIERMKAGIKIEIEQFASEYDNKVRAEAIKEFAGALIKIAQKGFWDEDAYVGVMEIESIMEEMIRGNE